MSSLRKQPNNKSDTNSDLVGLGTSCHARKWMGTELLLCLKDISKCEWAILYKNGSFFCRHPDAQHFVTFENRE